MEIQYALIKDNVVQNVIVADAEFAAAIAPDWQAVILLNQPDGTLTPCGIGWAWDGTVFIAPPQPEPLVGPEPIP